MTHDRRQNPPNFATDSLHKRKQEKVLERIGCEWQVSTLPSSAKYTNLNKYNQVHVRGVFYSASLKRDSGLKWVKKLANNKQKISTASRPPPPPPKKKKEGRRRTGVDEEEKGKKRRKDAGTEGPMKIFSPL